MRRSIVIMRMTFALFFIAISLQAGAAEQGAQPLIINNHPEDVVNKLLEFDFNGGYRQAPETYPNWFPLTTRGEPDYSDVSPYWSCPIVGILGSYKVLSSELVEPNKALVFVEMEMVAISILEKGREAGRGRKCDWSGLSPIDSGNKDAIENNLATPLAATELVKIITGKTVEELCNKTNRCIEGQETVLSLDKDRRRWRYKFNVEFATPMHESTKRWLIPSDSLPRPFHGLSAAISHMKREFKSIRDEVRICTNLAPAPSPYYRESVCPSILSRKHQVTHALKINLNTLNALKKEIVK